MSQNRRSGSTSDVEARRQSVVGGTQTCVVQPCGKKLTTLDYVLWCKRCGGGVHSRCLGMKDSQFKSIQSLEQFVPYYCQKCQKNISEMDKRFDVLETEVASLKKGGAGGDRAVGGGEFGQLEACSGLVAKVVETVLGALLPKLSDMIHEGVAEVMEIAQKKDSLVLVGVPEGDNDADVVQEICDKLNVASDSIGEFFRSGRKDSSKPRIMKLKFKNSIARRKVLYDFSDHRSSIANCEHAFIRRDMTYKERQRDFALREELKRRRSAGEQCKIAKGKIVPLIIPLNGQGSST